MATVGQQLLQPEEGWRRYDDTDIRFLYKGIWKSFANDSQDYNTTRYNMHSNDAEFSFDFYGEKVRIITNNYTTRSTDMRLVIDDMEFSFNCYAATSSRRILSAEVNNLKIGRHSAKIYIGSFHLAINDSTSPFSLDAIDIDANGRLLHPDEVINIDDLDIGKRIRANYAAPNGVFGVFNELGKESSDFLLPTPVGAPKGDFYFIMTGLDNKGRKLLIADRNIQHSISWNALNAAKVATESGLPWRFNKDWNKLTNYFSFDETSGNVTDSKGSAIGTVSNVTRVTGYNGEGNALSFNGTNGYVQFNNKVIPENKDFSIRFKIYCYSLSSTNGNMIFMNSSSTASTSSGFRLLFFNGDTWNFAQSNGSQYKEHKFTFSPILNKWYDVLITFKNSVSLDGVKVYIDDFNTPMLISSVDFIQSTSSSNLFLGRQVDSSTRYFNGLLDNLEIYNEIITPLDSSVLDDYQFNLRLLTGGTSSEDKENEWDNYIVNSTLNETIVAGDDKVWNWNIAALRTWTSTIPEGRPDLRVLRGNATTGTAPLGIDARLHTIPTENNSSRGFRPILIISSRTKYYVVDNGIYKILDNEGNWQTVQNPYTSEYKMYDLSVLDRQTKTLNNVSLLVDTLEQGKVYKSAINLNEIIELKSISVE